MSRTRSAVAAGLLGGLLAASAFGCRATGFAGSAGPAPRATVVAGEVAFRWRASAPLVAAAPRDGDDCVAVKDPSLVQVDGRWHLFTTTRCRGRTHSIEHRSFTRWSEAGSATPQRFDSFAGYVAAPQIVFFTPLGCWLLLVQIPAPGGGLQPAFSTSPRIDDPASFSALRPLVDPLPDEMRRGIDFWLIADETRVHLFYSTLDGRLWRAETARTAFPSNWSPPVVALEGDLFEAGHVYRLGESGAFLAIVEAIGANGRRLQKAHLADRLDGRWRPLAASATNPFASAANVRAAAAHWADSISHGELIRAGLDERLLVDPSDLRFVFQGATDGQMRGVPYGAIPWRLGILEPEARPEIGPRAAPGVR